MNTMTTKHIDTTHYRTRLMDLRDERIRVQRYIIELRGIELWEPENFTKAQAQLLTTYENLVANIKRQEQHIRAYLYN